MFWEQQANIYDGSHAASLTDEEVETITITELFERLPNLVSDYDAKNEKVVAILKRRDVLEDLIKHITHTPPDCSEPHIAMRFKYAHQTCALFSSRSLPMEAELIQNHPDLLDRLIKYVDTEQILNPLMASLWATTLFSIYNKFTEPMVQYFASRPIFMEWVFRHIDTPAIMDLVIKISTCEVITTDARLINIIFQWLNSVSIVERIVDIFKTTTDASSLENSAHILICIIQKARLTLMIDDEERKFYRFYNIDWLAQLVDICFSHKTSAIYIVQFLIQFVDYDHYVKTIESIKPKYDPSLYGYKEEKEALKTLCETDLEVNNMSLEYLSSIKKLHKVMLSRLNKFKQLLLESIPKHSVRTTTGIVEVPMGTLRLEIIHLFYALLIPNNPEMDEAFSQAKMLEHLIDLFFEYDYNTFLHNHVNNIVTTIFLNANVIRFKLMCDDAEKEYFMQTWSADKMQKPKDKTFMQLFNQIWSDSECYQFFKRSFGTTQKEEKKESHKKFARSDLIVKQQLEYTPLISQLFNECNLIERIMIRYKSIMSAKEQNPKQAVPTNKSHLIDMAETINKYLNDYEQSANTLPEQLLQTRYASVRTEWHLMCNNEMAEIRKKIENVEQSTKSQQSAEWDFKKFIFQHRIQPVDLGVQKDNTLETLRSSYCSFLPVYETVFDHSDAGTNDAKIPSTSKSITKSFDYFKASGKFKCEMPVCKKFNEAKSVEEESIQMKDDTELFDEKGDQTSSILTEKEMDDNVFRPLASSSNISNELNIEMDEMDSDIVKEDDNRIEHDSFERSLATGEKPTEQTAEDQGDVSKDDTETEMQVEESPQKEEEDPDWSAFEKERAGK